MSFILKEELDLSCSVFPYATGVLNRLLELSEIQLYYQKHGLRHPIALYAISFGSVTDRMNVVIDQYEKALNNRGYLLKKENWDGPLLESLDHMLDAIFEHLDTGEDVLRCFFEQTSSKECKKATRAFEQSITPYKRHVAKIVNYIKHNQGRLRGVAFHWPLTLIPGYFIEGPVGDGIGPAPVIHGDPGGAFSLSRDMRFHICGLYWAARKLSMALHAINPALTHKSLSKNHSENAETNLRRLLQRVADLPAVFFPDELERPVPDVSYGKQKIRIQMPSHTLKPGKPPGGAAIQASSVGDGVTRTFSFPRYFKSLQRLR